MTVMTGEQKRKAVLKETFDTVADGYDGNALRFFAASADHLASVLALRGDEHVLDVATGTGNAALALAGRLPKGRVTGVDFSAGMLDQARRKAVSLNIMNVEFLERDMADLGFPDGQFDAAVCAFGIFFVDDMDTQLARICSAVRSGGKVAITCFEENYFSPMKELFFTRLAGYGVPMPPQTWRRIATEAGCRELYAGAGLGDIRVERRNMGYFLKGPDGWWDIIWNAGLRRMVTQLAQDAYSQFREEHLREVAALASRDGIWLDVGVLFTIGMKG